MPVAPPSETRGRREGGGEEGGRRYGEGGERVTEQGVGAGGESGAGSGREREREREREEGHTYIHT